MITLRWYKTFRVLHHETQPSMKLLLENMRFYLKLGKDVFKLILEPGDRTHYELLFIECGGYWMVINELRGEVLSSVSGCSPEMLDAWCRDTGCVRWNRWTLHVVAQILEELHGVDAAWFNWDTSKALFTEAVKP